MTTIATTPSISWASAHRALLTLIGALVAVAVAVAVTVLLMSGQAAPASGDPEIRVPGASEVPPCSVVRGPC